jgi:hypothetical protein
VLIEQTEAGVVNASSRPNLEVSVIADPRPSTIYYLVRV